ncbi:hypothetical protein KFE98_15985 [bacterium SCSIO 12741]|nr:hypothetical protein KFE98_15985 [bacterium SCSIO 12741]
MANIIQELSSNTSLQKEMENAAFRTIIDLAKSKGYDVTEAGLLENGKSYLSGGSFSDNCCIGCWSLLCTPGS